MLEESKCKVKFIRQSPYKVRFVLDSVRGKKVNYALDFLEFSNKKAAKFISKALNSALSNYSQKKDSFDSEIPKVIIQCSGCLPLLYGRFVG